MISVNNILICQVSSNKLDPITRTVVVRKKWDRILSVICDCTHSVPRFRDLIYSPPSVTLVVLRIYCLYECPHPASGTKNCRQFEWWASLRAYLRTYVRRWNHVTRINIGVVLFSREHYFVSCLGMQLEIVRRAGKNLNITVRDFKALSRPVCRASSHAPSPCLPLVVSRGHTQPGGNMWSIITCVITCDCLAASHVIIVQDSVQQVMNAEPKATRILAWSHNWLIGSHFNKQVFQSHKPCSSDNSRH